MKKIVGRLQLFRDQIRRKVGVLLFDRQAAKPELKKIKNILVIRWDAKLGDSYISSFFFREIKKIPNTHVTVVTTPDLEDLYRSGFGAGSVLVVNKRPKYKELKNIASKIGKVDLVIHLTEFMKMKDLYFLSLIDAKNVASMDDEINRVNIKMTQQTQNLLFHDKYVYLLNLLSVPEVDDSYIIPYSKVTGIKCKEYDLIINFFGSTEHKSVAIERASVTLITIAKSDPTLNIGLLSSPYTVKKAHLIASRVNLDNVSVIDNINTIDDAINIISNTKVVISVDTSIVHIASGLKKRTLAIYPKMDGVFNPWLPPATEQVSVLFSHYQGVNVNVNNYCDQELMKLIKGF